MTHLHEEILEEFEKDENYGRWYNLIRGLYEKEGRVGHDIAFGVLKEFESFLLSALKRYGEAKDQAYAERNKLVSFLARIYPAHIKLHPESDKTWELDWRT